MSEKEILEKAIRKAIADGWNAEIRGDSLYIGGFDNATASYHGSSFPGDYNVIFNHDFAKALWGDKPMYYEVDSGDPETRWLYYGSPVVDKAWRFHLQQMVIADDKIKYLGENI